MSRICMVCNQYFVLCGAAIKQNDKLRIILSISIMLLFGLAPTTLNLAGTISNFASCPVTRQVSSPLSYLHMILTSYVAGKREISQVWVWPLSWSFRRYGRLYCLPACLPARTSGACNVKYLLSLQESHIFGRLRSYLPIRLLACLRWAVLRRYFSQKKKGCYICVRRMPRKGSFREFRT